MISNILILISFLWLSPLLAADVGDQSSIQDPQQLIHSITDNVLNRLKTQRQAMQHDPHQIYALVEELVLPYFDFERMSRWVLGRYWNDATAEQREQFIAEFSNLLIRTYGVALLDYTDEDVQFLPSRGDPAQGEVIIRATIKHHGSSVGIDSNLYLTADKWKIYDVAINGVSLVNNYRNSFAAEIRKTGLNGLIKRLNERNQSKDKNDG